MNAVMVAWFLLSLWLIGYAARVALADLREGHGGQSWCLDCRDGLACDCLVPEQRQPERIGGRY